jgi:hypothetical protein
MEVLGRRGLVSRPPGPCGELPLDLGPDRLPGGISDVVAVLEGQLAEPPDLLVEPPGPYEHGY